MKKLIKKFEDIMVAITFAEAGEYDEAARQAGTSMREEVSNGLDSLKRPAAENARK
jgi:hypothetical protein